MDSMNFAALELLWPCPRMTAISDHWENVTAEIDTKELNSGTVRPECSIVTQFPAQSARFVVEKKSELF
jgi:hypothetical protein